VDSVQIETGLGEVLEFLTEERVTLVVVLLSVSGNHDVYESCSVSRVLFCSYRWLDVGDEASHAMTPGSG